MNIFKNEAPGLCTPDYALPNHPVFYSGKHTCLPNLFWSTWGCLPWLVIFSSLLMIPLAFNMNTCSLIPPFDEMKPLKLEKWNVFDLHPWNLFGNCSWLMKWWFEPWQILFECNFVFSECSFCCVVLLLLLSLFPLATQILLLCSCILSSFEQCCLLFKWLQIGGGVLRSCQFLVLSIWSHSHIHHCCSVCSLFSPLFFLFSLYFPPFVFFCSFPSFPAFCDVDFCFVLLQLSLISHWFVFLFVFFLLLICLAFSLFPSDVTFICSPFCVSCYQ